jgi:hypothetical protein
MFSYFFGYTDDNNISETKEVYDDDAINKIKQINGEIPTEEEIELKYKSITKNYELNKQIRRVATKLKLNKTIQNKYIEDETYLDMVEPLKTRRIVRHKRSDSQESIYEVLHNNSPNFNDNIISFRDTEYDVINLNKNNFINTSVDKNKIPRRR